MPACMAPFLRDPAAYGTPGSNPYCCKPKPARIAALAPSHPARGDVCARIRISRTFMYSAHGGTHYGAFFLGVDLLHWGQ